MIHKFKPGDLVWCLRQKYKMSNLQDGFYKRCKFYLVKDRIGIVINLEDIVYNTNTSIGYEPIYKVLVGMEKLQYGESKLQQV